MARSSLPEGDISFSAPRMRDFECVCTPLPRSPRGQNAVEVSVRSFWFVEEQQDSGNRLREARPSPPAQRAVGAFGEWLVATTVVQACPLRGLHLHGQLVSLVDVGGEVESPQF